MAQYPEKPTYILGYSGLDGYLEFKNSHITGLSKFESYVSQGMDAAAAIIKDGKIIAACAEERFTGSKHTGSFPKNAIDACLHMAGITIEDITFFAHNFNYEPYRELLELNEYTDELYKNVLSNESQISLFKKYYSIDITEKYHAVDHHEAHALYTFDTSGFDTSLVVIADGLGEYSSISIYKGTRTEGLSLLETYSPTSSLGMLYSAVTDYLGFVTNSDEYKIMGLAAYGDPAPYKELFNEIVNLGPDGSIQINHLLPEKIDSPLDRETYRVFKRWLSEQVFPERNPEAELEQQHKDFTAALQARLNEAMHHLVSYWKQKTNLNNLTMAGGVALNCVANAYIAQQKIFEGIYIAPASADDGTALGAAIAVLRTSGEGLDSCHYTELPFYGPPIELNPSNPTILEYSLTLREVTDTELVDEIATEILNGKIIAWAQGNMEFGPRALGHRSILADPRQYEMRDRLNVVTKQRENFRPFAPLVKEESIETYFNTIKGVVYKHMLVNVTVKKDHRHNLQAITHVDGTARVQSVSKHDLPILWKLLDAVEQRIGLPVLLNTSFNLKSMPIVCSDKDALKAFVDSDIDLLVINNTIIGKSDH